MSDAERFAAVAVQETRPSGDPAACSPGSQDAAPLLSVLVPVFNERATIAEILQRILDVDLDKEVVVVDDGSTDGTRDVLREWDGRAGIRVLLHPQNQGKGMAVRTALAAARGRYCLVQDADLEYNPAEYPRLLAPLQAGSAQVVYGSRYLRGARNDRWRLFRQGVRLLNGMVRILYGARLTDVSTCHKLLSTELLRSLELECRRFEFCPEVTAKLCRLGVTIHEVPISYLPRTLAEGKKIRLRDGWEAIQTLWKYRRWRPSPMPVPLGGRP